MFYSLVRTHETELEQCDFFWGKKLKSEKWCFFEKSSFNTTLQKKEKKSSIRISFSLGFSSRIKNLTHWASCMQSFRISTVHIYTVVSSTVFDWSLPELYHCPCIKYQSSNGGSTLIHFISPSSFGPLGQNVSKGSWHLHLSVRRASKISIGKPQM